MGRKAAGPSLHAVRDSRVTVRRKNMAHSDKSNYNSRLSNNFEYKKELAFQLVKRFGMTAARQTCIQNKWDEVLKAVDSVRIH